LQDERILNEKRRYRDLPFDVQPVPSADLPTLSRITFEQEYLPNAFATDILAMNNRTYEERLSACKMIGGVDFPHPTVVGLLVLGKAPRDWLPGAYVQFLRISGCSLSDPVIDESQIDGQLAQVVRRIDEKIEAHNTRSVDIASASIETRQTPFPRVALQQLVRNAVLHRSYEGTNAPVRVYWFDDRIEIHNPGGPFGSVTTANFGQAGLTDYRNPHIADSMRVLGLVQRFGVGIATARKELANNGNPPPEFSVSTTHVLVTVRKRVT
jgi:ATP-dependent DNA helicase RecG